MRRLILSFWPGLRGVWDTGDSLGLLTCFVFSVLLNACLLSAFVWTEIISSGARVFLWLTTLTFWGFFAIATVRRKNSETGDTSDQVDLFLIARGEYLKGEWDCSVKTLKQRLRRQPRDVEARLMLATVFRHQGKQEEAREELRKLQRLEHAADWNMEIEREWRSIVTTASNVTESLNVDDADFDELNDMNRAA